MNKLFTATILAASVALVGCGGGGGGSVTVPTGSGSSVSVSDAQANVAFETGQGSNGASSAYANYSTAGTATIDGKLVGSSDTGRVTVHADGSFSDSDGTTGTWERQSNGEIHFSFVENGRNKTTRVKPGATISYTRSAGISGVEVPVEATVDGTNLVDFDRVDNGNHTPFIITNVATGTAAGVDLRKGQSQLTNEERNALTVNSRYVQTDDRGYFVRENRYGRAITVGIHYDSDQSAAHGYNADQAQELKTVHGQGWLGQGATINFRVSPSGNTNRDTPYVWAPEATIVRDDLRTGTDFIVTNNARVLDGTSEPLRTDNKAVAGTSALVISKFNTLSGVQAEQIVEATRRNNVVSPVNALSPVGNLN